MGHANVHQLVFTVRDRCRVCYTCVRECPAKAIRIINGQAEVVSERCIGCGNCLAVCSQGAKMLVDLTRHVEEMLLDPEVQVAALVAPSFSAEFTDLPNLMLLPSMLRKLGFKYVFEVAFGADLVAEAYRKLQEEGNQTWISSDCPAVVFYIEQYYPQLVSHLAPVVSPVVAMSRVIRKWHADEGLKLVFIGPCIAKKAESDELDGALTFKEVRSFFEKYNVTPEGLEASQFDEPIGAYGAIFPLIRGLSTAMYPEEHRVERKVIVSSGRKAFKEAIRAFSEGKLEGHHLELLCCEGCMLGPGMSEKNNEYVKQIHIQQYVQQKIKNISLEKWHENKTKALNEIDFKQQFHPMDRRLREPSQSEISQVLLMMGKNHPSDQLNCGACGYDTCHDHAIAVINGFADLEMCLPYALEKLHKSFRELHETNEKLRNARLALKHSEKLAILGQISAGIAHELNNPLGIIMMNSHLLLEEIPDTNPVKNDIQIIAEQAQRCKNIVSGLLNFARKQKVKYQLTNVIQLLEKTSRQLIIPSNVSIVIDSRLQNPEMMIDPDQFLDVFINLYKNAIDAMPNGGEIHVLVEEVGNQVKIHIKDQGIGIPEENRDKLFMPFFTTKEVGKGTGLGLALVYGIVKMHQGKIEINSNADPSKGATFTEFIITLPRLN
ncbi:MAG: ATP-binding protein [Bacteroidales bacterium]|nr:ATP-binding protein [Bacteroidales bacterium]